MTLCINGWTLEQISAAISIATPIILLIWFYYSQKQTLSKNYYSEIDGIYAGFTAPINKAPTNGTIYGGIIMNIRDIDNKGYFKGEFDFGEIESIGNRHNDRSLIDGTHFFYGKVNFTPYRDKTRHPFKPKKNRTYRGKLYIVDRLDFSFDNYKIEDYLCSEYDIIHYREMQTLKFTLNKVYKKKYPSIPPSFILYKSAGFNFEPYINVKKTVFIVPRADK
jgi:hypothetical protein